jgi:hypothetical protein
MEKQQNNKAHRPKGEKKIKHKGTKDPRVNINKVLY